MSYIYIYTYIYIYIYICIYIGTQTVQYIYVDVRVRAFVHEIECAYECVHLTCMLARHVTLHYVVWHAELVRKIRPDKPQE